LKCGGKTEAEALLCDGCAEASLQEPKFFLNPVLIGPSLYSRLRETSTAAYLLGPTSGSDIITVPSVNVEKIVQDMNPQMIPHEDLKGFYQRCDSILTHLGVPVKLDSREMLLTEDAANTIVSIVLKVNAAEKMFPMESMSDLYIRIGVVYWSAANGLLMRVTSKKWSSNRKSYLVSRAKEYFSKVGHEDDLYSIASRNLGMLCLDAQEWFEAEGHLSDAMRSFPNDVKIGEGIARAHLMLGNKVEALTKVDEVINISETPELWVLKGKVLRSMDRAQEAIECFNRALSIDPRYMPAHEILISTLKDTGRLEDAALAENQKALSKRPGLERKINDLILEFTAAGEEKALAARASGLSVTKPEQRPPVVLIPTPSLMDSARRALKTEDYDTAIQHAREFLKQTPGSPDAELVLIEAFMSTGDIKNASLTTNSFYEKNRNHPLAWYWRGVVAHKEGRWGASIQYFSKAVSLDPNLVDGWVTMGEVLLSNGKLTGADESFSRALQIEETSPRAWLGKAKVMKQMGRWGAAIQCLDRYNSLAPSDKSPWLLKADTLLDKEKWERAIEAYDMYLKLNQDDSYALGKKGIALNAIGRVEEARECFEESVRLDPKNREAAKWLSTIDGRGGA
jgi:tetratricopeptide (TPR) repeat protein